MCNGFFESDVIWVSRENFGDRMLFGQPCKIVNMDSGYISSAIDASLPSNSKRIRLLPVEFITKYFKEVFDP